MNRIQAIITGIVLLLLCYCPPITAQQTTEFFIPVGQSPGISNTVTLIGKITAFNDQTRTLAFESPTGSWTASLEGNTLIWMDRSRLTLPNHVGSFSDLRKGRLVEVKYSPKSQRGRGAAEWIKVQLPVEHSTLGKNRNEGK